MPNIVITIKSPSKSIQIEFNDLSQAQSVSMEKAVVYKNQPIRLERNEDGVEIVLHGVKKLDLNHDIVESVDGVTITSNDQLYDELDTIITNNLLG